VTKYVTYNKIIITSVQPSIGNMASLATTRPTVGIIGGGIAGLSCARTLEKHGYKCQIFDTGSRGVGGRASSRGIVDHAVQFIAVKKQQQQQTKTAAPFRAQLKTWQSAGVVQQWDSSRIIGSSPTTTDYYIGSRTHGMSSIPTFLSDSLNSSPITNCWVSPSNGLRKKDKSWEIYSKGKQVGRFDAVVIAHNGKCAERLTSKIPAKRINQLLKVKFDDRPTKNKMTLNSIYSLIVEIQQGVLRDDIDGMFCSTKSDILDFVVCQTRKYATPTPKKETETETKANAETETETETETWTLLSNATYAKKNKQPQEFLEGTKKTHDVIQCMFKEMLRLLGNNEKKSQRNQKDIAKNIVSTKLQLWGAGVPLNVWCAKDNSDFLWDHEHQIGVVGDWLKAPSIAGAFESGLAFGNFFHQQERETMSRGLVGKFQANNSVGGGDDGCSALVGGGGGGDSRISGSKISGSGSGRGGSGRGGSGDGSGSISGSISGSVNQHNTNVSIKSHPRVLIVGAGLVGALTAHELRKRNPNTHMTVIEMARGAGGRASTTRWGNPIDVRANTGAQYLSTSSANGLSAALMQSAVDAGLLVKANDDEVALHSRCFSTTDDKVDFVATKGTSEVIKFFLSSADIVHYGTRVRSLEQNSQGGWTVTSKQKGRGPKKRTPPQSPQPSASASDFDSVVLAMPPNDAMRILSGETLKQCRRLTKQVQWHSRFSIALWWKPEDHTLASEFITAAALSHNNSAVDGRKILDTVVMQHSHDDDDGGGIAVVIQSTSKFWSRHRNTNAGGGKGGGIQSGGGASSGRFEQVTGHGRGAVRDEMLAALQRLVPTQEMPLPANLKMLNWKTSQVKMNIKAVNSENKKNCIIFGMQYPGLILAGDWASGESSFEGCVDSARAAVDACCIDSSDSRENRARKRKSGGRRKRKPKGK
jgi:predicted NAD/FAD-dependent oxidoreductase